MQPLIMIVLIGLLGGVAVGFQAPLSSLLSQRLGILESVFIVHAGCALFVSLPLLLLGGGRLREWHTAPWYALIAGAFGIIVIGAISTAIPRLGVAATVLLVVVGQLLVSAIIDQFGLFGADVRPINLTRSAGLVCLALGAWLIVR